MHENWPLVNIITVAYNAKNDLEKTLASVISQDYPRINYIVIDGGSSDGTVEIIERYQKRINIYVSEKDKGIYDAMNKGILKVKEGYLNFLNAGDKFISNHTISDIFKNIGGRYDLVYGKIIVGEVTDEKLKNPLETRDFTKNELLSHNTAVLCHQAMFIKKEAVPLYDTSYKVKGDLDWYFEIIKKNPHLSFYRSDVVVTNYKGRGMSERRYYLDMYELAKLIVKRFGIIAFFRYKCYKSVIKRVLKELII